MKIYMIGAGAMGGVYGGLLFRAGYDTDFGPLYDRIGNAPGIAPEVLLPADRVISRGTPTDQAL